MASAEPQDRDTKKALHEPTKVSDVFQATRIALDSYDDLFSDFDPSPYENRLLSADFVRELYRRHGITPKGDTIVNFTLPAKMRSAQTEDLIRKRLKAYFKDKQRKVDRRAHELRKKGMVRISVGVFFTFALVLFPWLDAQPFITLVSVLIWFFMWTGFDSMLNSIEGAKGRREFYDRFLRAKYNFTEEEVVIKQVETALAVAPQVKP